MFNYVAAYFVLADYKVIGFITIEDDRFLAMVGAVSALCDTGGSVVWGFVADYFTYKVALVLSNGSFTVFLLTFYASSIAGKTMFIIWVGVLCFCMAGIYVYPSALARTFGVRHYSRNFPLLNTSQVMASIISSMIDTLLRSYLPIYGTLLFISGLTFVSFILAIIYQPKRYISTTITE